ncbi:hypothetical protein [Microvirga massiliensis]|uniref:hypothetical protein n=1 Tax=Microvirga massiliensis TaxID=1033741 RepID=UPI000AFD18FA|nr:hypothetical protein [Microvirga massiliensis]
MTDDEMKQQFIVNWAARLFSDFLCPPLPVDDVRGILKATGLAPRRPEIEIAQHLAGIKSLLSVLDASRNRHEEWKAEQEAVAEVRKLIRLLRRKLDVLSNPEAPLSRAVRKGAYVMALEKGRLPSLNLAHPDELRTARQYAASLVALGEALEQRGQFEQLQQRGIERLPGEMKTLLESLERYGKNTDAPMRPGSSRAQWNRIIIGDVLPALYQHYFDRDFGISNNSGAKKRGGPGLRFLRSVAEAVGAIKDNGEPYGDEGLRKLWTMAKDDPWIKIPTETTSEA